MVKPLQFTVRMPTPSLNETLRWHWATARKHANKWLMAIWAHTNREWLTDDKRRRLTIERRGKRLLDEDNLAGGAKIAIDSIKSIGLIVDDSPKWLELHMRQSKLAKGEAPHTIFTLEDL